MADSENSSNNRKKLSELLPIVKCSFEPSRYERILLTELRDKKTETKDFRTATQKIGTLLINKIVECLRTTPKAIETPLTETVGEALAHQIELVSILRSGDALLHTFAYHFPEANISKILVQRDETTAEPHFIYKKLSATIAAGNPVVITEPMIATGGTLDMVISLLKEIGVREEDIFVASVIAALEGLLLLNQKYPKMNVVFNVLDQKLNEIKYIVPGLGDFGDRYFGT